MLQNKTTLFVGLRLAAFGVLLLSCGEPPLQLGPPVESALVHPAGLDSPPFSIQLPGLLPLADVEVETRLIDFSALEESSALVDGWALEPTLGQAWGTGSGSAVIVRMPNAFANSKILRFFSASPVNLFTPWAEIVSP